MRFIIYFVNVNHHTTIAYIENGCLNVSSTSHNMHVDPEFILLLNPTLSHTIVHYNLYKPDDLKICNQNPLGETLFEEISTNLIKGSIELDFSKYSNGIYIINLQTSSVSKTMKLIKT